MKKWYESLNKQLKITILCLLWLVNISLLLGVYFLMDDSITASKISIALSFAWIISLPYAIIFSCWFAKYNKTQPKSKNIEVEVLKSINLEELSEVEKNKFIKKYKFDLFFALFCYFVILVFMMGMLFSAISQNLSPFIRLITCNVELVAIIPWIITHIVKSVKILKLPYDEKVNKIVKIYTSQNYFVTNKKQRAWIWFSIVVLLLLTASCLYSMFLVDKLLAQIIIGIFTTTFLSLAIYIYIRCLSFKANNLKRKK